MKRPEQMSDQQAKMVQAVKDWIGSVEPAEVKGVFHVPLASAFSAYKPEEWRPEVERQLAAYGWRVSSFEYTKVIVSPA